MYLSIDLFTYYLFIYLFIYLLVQQQQLTQITAVPNVEIEVKQYSLFRLNSIHCLVT